MEVFSCLQSSSLIVLGGCRVQNGVTIMKIVVIGGSGLIGSKLVVKLREQRGMRR